MKEICYKEYMKNTNITSWSSSIWILANCASCQTMDKHDWYLVRLIPQTKVTLADFGYHVYVLLFYFSQTLLNDLAFQWFYFKT